MHATDVLVDAFGRIASDVHRAVAGLEPDDLTLRLDAEANPVAWLVWHLTRVIDDHVADLEGHGLDGQVWTAQGFADRFALPLDPGSIGYGHTSDQVAAVRPPVELLLGYHDAVQDHVVSYLGRIADADLDEVIDASWDPPVTRGVRLISVVDDGIQHAGQAAYVAGIARRQH